MDHYHLECIVWCLEESALCIHSCQKKYDEEDENRKKNNKHNVPPNAISTANKVSEMLAGTFRRSLYLSLSLIPVVINSEVVLQTTWNITVLFALEDNFRDENNRVRNVLTEMSAVGIFLCLWQSRLLFELIKSFQ